MKKNVKFKRNILFLLLLIVLGVPMHLNAEQLGVSESKQITLSYVETSLKTVLIEIEKQSNHFFVYNHQVVNVNQKVSIQVSKASLNAVLSKLLTPLGVEYKFSGKQIILSHKGTSERTPSVIDVVDENSVSPVTTQATSPGSISKKASSSKMKTLQGVVLNTKKEPLTGVSVFSSDKRNGAYTQVDGSFRLQIPDSVSSVSAKLLGYKSKFVEIGEKSAKITIVLEDDINMLSNVVVTGYQTLSQERATGSFGVLSSKEIQNKLGTNLLDRIEGMLPGVFMKDGEVTVRGISTLYGNQAPLYVVDGFPYEGKIENLNPADVVNVTLLKDAAAASIYGARAANGVFVITTRSGKVDKLSVSFNANFFITPLPDVDYLQYMNSSQVVDFQQELFNISHINNSYDNQRSAKPAVLQALFDHEDGLISDSQLDAELNRLRQLDNRSQIKDLLLQKQFKQQYSLSVNGGTPNNQYYLSMNYVGNRGYDVGSKTQDINLHLKDRIKITDWLRGDFAVATTLGKNERSSVNGTSYFKMYLPYEMLQDAQGNPTSVRSLKSESELQRLREVGLYDERYNPLVDRDHVDASGRNTYLRIQGGFNVRFMEGLTLDLLYQTERESTYSKTIYDKESYRAKSDINNAAQIIDNEIIKNVPDGGQVFDNRGDRKSYTTRAQLNLDREFGSKHYVSALVGGEFRSVATSSTATRRFGFNGSNLAYIPVNSKDLASLKGTQSIYSTFYYDESSNNYYTELEDRYVSFYANAGYTYAGKYTATASARIDDSNLFGSDPKYRYLPMWSVGGSWNMDKEPFLNALTWIDQLIVRATYGVNGNVVREVGPFLQAQVYYLSEAESTTTRIISPPNRSLRWEKTAVTNLGLSFSIFGKRLSGTIDYYNKKTTDLLGNREIDPTNAFSSSLMNYGSMINRGIEIGLNSVNVRTRSFSWTTGLNFSYNKNKMTKISAYSETLSSYTNGFGTERVGYPMGSLFNYRWAGLNPENGTPMVYDRQGNIIKNCDESGAPLFKMTDTRDLVYAGTMHPKYTVGFTNTFTWKGLSATIVIIGNGGHVLRDAVPMIHSQHNYDQNITRRASNFWRKSGDEKRLDVMPAVDAGGQGTSDYGTLWTAADINTVKGDYLKVRDIILTYELPKTLFGKEYFSSARLTFQVQNPFKWVANNRGIDPEAYYAASIYAQRVLPAAPCYIIGFDITF